MLSEHAPASGQERIGSSCSCFIFFSRLVALFPLYMQNVQLLSLVPPVPGCVGQGLAAQITAFLFLPSKILISDFLDTLQAARLLKVNVCTK